MLHLTEWTLKEITDPEFRKALAPHAENIFGTVILHLADGSIRVSKRLAFINLFGWQLLSSFGIPIRIEHYCRRKPLNNSAIARDWDKFYKEVTTKYPGPDTIDRFRSSLWQAWFDLYEFCSTELLSYSATIDIFDMADIMEHPLIKEVVDTKEKIDANMGSDVIEKKITHANDKIVKILCTKGAVPNNALYPYQQVKQLNKFQIPQVLYMFGVRTDISDNIVRLPVVGSAISGIRNIQEYAVESLAAKKAAFYNKVAVRNSQYKGRVTELITSSLPRIYKTDCGSTALVDFEVTKDNYRHMEGTVIYENGVRMVITDENMGSFVGKTVHMRSPATCLYRQGVCSECGGETFNNIPANIHIGLLSAVNLIETVTQKILSAKHLIKTKSLLFELTGKAADIFFRSSTHEVRWHPRMFGKTKDLKIGIPLAFFGTLHDVKLLRTIKDVKAERFSKVEYVMLKDKNDKVEYYPLTYDDQVPYFSSEVLIHLRDHYDQIEIIGDDLWFPVADTEKMVLFNVIVINDNMLQFVKRVEKFLDNELATYSSVSDALQAFATIVHDKAELNLCHLGVVLKAYMITSDTDYRIPKVEDANNVKFGTTKAILNNRHVGPKLIFEELAKYISDPNTYLVRKQASQLDVLTVGP